MSARIGGAVVLLLATLLTPVQAGAESKGYRVASRTEVAPGLEHLSLGIEGPAQSVHVARIAPDAPYALRTVLAQGVVGSSPGRERTSSMCKRVDCLVAVNGDFADLARNEPIGAVVRLGELVRTPTIPHHQLLITRDGELRTTGSFSWRGRLVSTDLEELGIDGVNVPRHEDQLILYTPSNGESTRSNPHGHELLLRVLDPPSPLRIGQTATVRLESLREDVGNTRLEAGTAVLSGHGEGAAALADLWRRASDGTASREALLRLETDPPMAESVGGSPIIVREGRRWFHDSPTHFVRGRHPRTIVGWTATGEVLVVTVDGRQPGHGEGMTLAEAADLMIELGAVEAINLDGGGSTTFVVRGAVKNRPSDRLVRSKGIVQSPSGGAQIIGNVERPVTVALAVVPRTVAELPAARPAALGGVELPQALAMPIPLADPASDPAGSMPALVITERPDGGDRTPVAAAVILLVAAMLVAHPATRPRRSPYGSASRS